MYYVYLLKSEKDKDFYMGFTNNLERRIKEHNNGFVVSARSRKPFDLIYCEGYRPEKDARKKRAKLEIKVKSFHSIKKTHFG